MRIVEGSHIITDLTHGGGREGLLGIEWRRGVPVKPGHCELSLSGSRPGASEMLSCGSPCDDPPPGSTVVQKEHLQAGIPYGILWNGMEKQPRTQALGSE